MPRCAAPTSRWCTIFWKRSTAAELAAVTVRYPVHALASPRRFLLEAYPLAGLLPDCALDFEPGNRRPALPAGADAEERPAAASRVFAPNRSHVGCTGATLLSPTGWLRVQPPSRRSARNRRRRSRRTTSASSSRLSTAVERHAWPAARTLLRAPGHPGRPARHRAAAAGGPRMHQQPRSAARGHLFLVAGDLPAPFGPRARATAGSSPGRSCPTCVPATLRPGCASASRTSRSTARKPRATAARAGRRRSNSWTARPMPARVARELDAAARATLRHPRAARGVL